MLGAVLGKRGGATQESLIEMEQAVLPNVLPPPPLDRMIKGMLGADFPLKTLNKALSTRMGGMAILYFCNQSAVLCLMDAI